MTSRYRVEQRTITHRDRNFHFISYEGQPGNAARNQPATDAAWFLVSGGYRREVMPQEPDQDVEELDRMLAAWLETHMFAESA